MENNELLEMVRSKAQSWLTKSYDAETKAKVQELLDSEDPTELIESFYKDLEFGTGGLRGIMGVGTNRMNIYTVGAATQGLSNYLKKEFANLDQIKVVIGHDCRNNSRKFAEISADIFSANGIKVYLFEDLRPTPEMSFAIRKLGCQSGIILTASHNPKEYNGYKAYWDDGAQMIAPHDRNTIAEVNKIRNASDIKFKGNKDLIEIIGSEIDNLYIDALTTISLSPEAIKRHHDMKIVYTPIHGTGVKIVPDTLKAFGFTNIIHVPEQDVVSGDFPTVISPNPEEPAALAMAVEKAKETDAELVMASDPDADRVGAAVKNNEGEWVLLNGNQTALMFVYYLITRWKELGKVNGKEYIVKTIVTTELIRTIAERNGVEIYDVYTGFKWIADVMKKNEGKKNYIGGGEESGLTEFLTEGFAGQVVVIHFGHVPAHLAGDVPGHGEGAAQHLEGVETKPVGLILHIHTRQPQILCHTVQLRQRGDGVLGEGPVEGAGLGHIGQGHHIQMLIVTLRHMIEDPFELIFHGILASKIFLLHGKIYLAF